MTLDEQRDVIERALGERMLNHAFMILHQWLQEIGFEQYGDRLQSLEQNYDALFRYFLTADDPDRENVLNEMTGEVYRLADSIFIDISLKRGTIPQMIGFNRDNMESVIRYFGSCPRLRDEDYDYMREVCVETPQPSIALLLLASLTHNLRGCFSEEAMLVLFEAIDSENNLIAGQALMNSIMLLIHYDIRIDFFPRVQNAFTEVIGDGERAFMAIMALITNANRKIEDMAHKIDLSKTEDVESAIQDAITEELGDEEYEEQQVISWVPSDEGDYMSGLVSMLPDTWLMDVVVGENEERAQNLSRAYLQNGSMDLWWDDLDTAEKLILQLLRSKNPTAKDYINYGHICFLRGDRVMAYENYREARRMLGSTKAFMAAFRPDRRFLVDRGITMDDVYLMEDQLVKK